MVKKLVLKIIQTYLRKRGAEMVIRSLDSISGIPVIVDDFPQSKVMPVATYSPWHTDIKFQSIYNQVKDNTLVDVFRCHELWQLATEIGSLEGDFIEIGVWKGGTGAIISKAANIYSEKAKIYLCDTFEGVVKAGIEDNRYTGGEHADTSEQVVNELVKELQLKNVRVLKGVFPDDTKKQVSNCNFKFCHIDVDVYKGAKEITEWLWNRLVIGGVIIYDDYGFKGTQGVTKFVNEQREKPDRLVLHNLNGHGVIIKFR